MAVIGASNSLGGLAGSNAIARLLVVISGDSTPLTAALAKANAEMGGLSKNASSIGNALTRNLSLPLLALGGYAIKAASDFETAVARVAGLTPFLTKTGDSVEELKAQLIDLASDPQIIVGPTELANALFLAGSAGLEADEAIDIVKLSAQGMSASMGEATDISKVLIASLNNYRSTGLTAAHAMDVLTVAIREGTAAPDELAIALGRLLPVARAAGVSIEATAASVAALTNLGVPTRVATTSLRALFSELLAPTQAAKKTLDEFGVSAQQLRDTLANNGPVAAFELLKRAVHGNVEALHDIIPQIRGFTAYLALTGSNAKGFRHIMDEMAHSTGSFQKALDLVSKTPEFQFGAGLKELKIAAIEVGQDLLPVFIALAKVFQQLGSAIGQSPAFVKAFIASFIGIGAVIGPIIKLYGSITAVADVTTRLATNATIALPTLKALALGIGAAAVSAIVAVGGFESLARGSTSLISIGSTLIGTFLAVKLALAGLQAAALKFGTGGILSMVLGSASGGALTAIAVAVGTIVTLIGLAAGASKRFDEAAEEMGGSLLEAAKSGDTLRAALKNIEDTEIRNELLNIAHAAGLMGKAVGEAFGPLAGGLVSKITANLRPLQNLTLFQGITGAAKLGDLANELQEAVTQGKDLDDIQRILNGSGNAYVQTLTQIMASESSTTEAQRGRAEAALREIATFTELIRNQRAYDEAQQNTIIATEQEQQAIQDLADSSGVSVDTIVAALGRYNVSAAGMSAETQASFLKAAAGVDENGNKITLKMREMQAAAEELAQSLVDSLSSGFSLFGELPEAVKGFDEIIAKAQQFGQIAVEQASNVKLLLERGVPTGLIDQFISQGPAMVAAFANATTPQLNKVVDAYDLAMGALDASILAEAIHQEGKGRRMVEGFATSILSASNLLPGVGAKIVAAVGHGLSTGTLKPQALSLITSFVHSLNTVSGLTRAAGSKAAQAFANGIATGDFVGPKGKLLVQQAARGIAANSSLTFKEAKTIVQNVADGMEGAKHRVLPAGHHVGSQAVTAIGDKTDEATTTGEKFVKNFAEGMSHNLTLIDTAAKAMADRAKSSLDKALSNSPYYFTLPMGEKLVSDLYLGVNSESGKHDPGPAVDGIITKFNQAFLRKIPRLNDSLDKLESLIKDNMKKAFEAGDLEMVKALEKTGKHLEDHLNKLHDRFTQFRQGIRAGFADFKDLIGGLSTMFDDFAQANKDAIDERDRLLASTDAAEQAKGAGMVIPSATPGTEDIQQLLADKLAKAQALADVLKKLAAAGLSQGVISQIAGQGEGGIALGNAILEGGADLIQQFNDTYAQLRAITQDTAEQLGEKYFGKAIRFATKSLIQFSENIVRLIKDLISGFGNANKELVKALSQLLANIKNFKIPQPSTGGGTGPSTGSGGGLSGPQAQGPSKPPKNPPKNSPPIVIHSPFLAGQVTNPYDNKKNDKQTVINAHVTVNGWVGNDQALASKVRDELLRVGRNNGGTGL